jgi:hypothetical protein
MFPARRHLALLLSLLVTLAVASTPSVASAA